MRHIVYNAIQKSLVASKLKILGLLSLLECVLHHQSTCTICYLYYLVVPCIGGGDGGGGGGGARGAMAPPLLWDTVCKKRSRYSNRTVIVFREAQCSKLLTYMCVVVNEEI